MGDATAKVAIETSVGTWGPGSNATLIGEPPFADGMLGGIREKPIDMKVRRGERSPKKVLGKTKYINQDLQSEISRSRNEVTVRPSRGHKQRLQRGHVLKGLEFRCCKV